MRCTTLENLGTRAFLFVAALVTASTSLAAGNDCPAILPEAANAISGPRLCQSAAGNGEFSVCREYRDDRTTYQVVFRGGTSPLAVYERAGASLPSGVSAPEETRRAVGNRRCDLERPQGVPAAAVYRGTGVCEDEQGRPLPCSVFEHAGAREPEALRYFVYYEPNGSGIHRIDAVSAGPNERMLEAEMAFQLGQSLTKSNCCRDRAQVYLAHAVALFPDDGAYRAALIAQQGERAGTQHTPMAAFSRMLEQSR